MRHNKKAGQAGKPYAIKTLDPQPAIKDGLILRSGQGTQNAAKALVAFHNECANLYEFKTESSLYRAMEDFSFVKYYHVRFHNYNGYRTPYQS